ncbi:hypothetical protein EBESD8_26600 [Rhodococcus aetherivorans]|nr:hypothetical protein EBESD8_26600 [Rhodococcus aetherivorans]
MFAEVVDGARGARPDRVGDGDPGALPHVFSSRNGGGWVRNRRPA